MIDASRKQTVKPSPYGQAVDPSGMPEECKQRMMRIVQAYGLQPVGRIPSPYGDIFIAERKNPNLVFIGLLIGGFDAIWAARETMEINIEFGPWTTREFRVRHMHARAMVWLKGRAEKFGERVSHG